MNLLATIAEGEVDWADVLLLIAVVLFAVAAIIPLVAKSIASALVPAGLTAMALALLVL